LQIFTLQIFTLQIFTLQIFGNRPRAHGSPFGNRSGVT
jgi:hypothetical protein